MRLHRAVPEPVEPLACSYHRILKLPGAIRDDRARTIADLAGSEQIPTTYVRKTRKMDIFTHLIVTRKLIGKDAGIAIASVAPDLPFYLTYPDWLISQGKAREGFTMNE